MSKLVKMNLAQRGQNFTQQNLDFGGYQTLFGADTTRKYEPVMS